MSIFSTMPALARTPNVLQAGPGAIHGPVNAGAERNGWSLDRAQVSGQSTCSGHAAMGAVEITSRQRTDWGDGATWDITITNHDDENAVTSLEVELLLPGATGFEPWGMVFDEHLPVVNATLPNWVVSLEPGQSHTFGFNVYPSAQPCQMRILFMELGSAELTPTPTPANVGDGAGEELPPVETPEPPAEPTDFPMVDPWNIPDLSPILTGPPSTEPLPVPGAPESPSANGRFAAPLHTQGRLILNRHREAVVLRGINWYGCETEVFTLHGLWTRSWKSLVDQIASEGFNTLRIPYSQDFLSPGRMPDTRAINYEANPDLRGLNARQILDKVVAYAAERKLYVILDRHALRHDERTELWYTGAREASASSNPYGEAAWIDGLTDLAQHYIGSAHVIGFDLHNEPHGRATWGTGDVSTDWRLAAERAGNALLSVNPNLLIIVEGVEAQVQGSSVESYWWGGNLSGVRDNPVRLNVADRIVYSPHDYGPGVYQQPWFYEASFPENLEALWTRQWAYIAIENRAPVLIGEFGGWNVEPDKHPEGSDAWREAVWQERLVEFQLTLNTSATYWCLNPESFDTGGYLNADWRTPVSGKQSLLRSWFAR